jgi:uncharacterized integral membrane protein
MIRKLVTAFVLVPLAVVLISLAVANRQSITLSLDPFDTTHPALSVSLPLFALILFLVIGGVILGGAAAWLRQGRWRRAARRAEAELRALRAESDQSRRRRGTTTELRETPPAGYAPRLSIPPPAA